jgi:hypothetical protein
LRVTGAERTLVMRKILIVLLVIIVTVSLLWICAGRHLSMFVDRFKIQNVALTPTSAVAYQGTGDGGVLIVSEHRLMLAPLNPHVGLTKDNQLAIASGGRVFALGPVRSSEKDALEADTLDNAPSFREQEGYLPWISFDHGQALHLNRNRYYEYVGTARDGQRLRMLWSVEPANSTTTLIRIDISNAAR